MKGRGGPGRWPEVARILDLALELAPEERPALLDGTCAGDPELRAEVEAILAGAEARVFFESPALAFADPLVEAEAAALEGAIIGAYRLIRELGHGGMGVVYLAERADGHFEQRVALKLIKRGMDSDEILRRFLAERQVLARLSHAHIARLLDGGVTAEGQPYFAMEYVEGVPLNRPARSVSWRSRSGWRCSRRSARRCSTPTRISWFTATSSPRTSWSPWPAT
jgi:serine/threonine protein kinase